MNVITLKKGAGTPGSDQLETAELALDVTRGDLYTKLDDGSVVQLNDIPDDAAPAGMVISATEPADPVDGMQWMDATTAIVWVWDEDKWLEFPAGGGGVGGSYDDTELRGLISDEVTAREEADNLLSGSIDDEATAREEADNLLSDSIDSKLDAEKIWTGTQAEYDNLTPDANTLYFITA